MKWQLKPCPFCGCKYVVRDVSSHQVQDTREGAYIRIFCVSCGASSKRFFIAYDDVPQQIDNLDEAVYAVWNRRSEEVKDDGRVVQGASDLAGCCDEDE